MRKHSICWFQIIFIVVGLLVVDFLTACASTSQNSEYAKQNKSQLDFERELEEVFEYRMMPVESES